MILKKTLRVYDILRIFMHELVLQKGTPDAFYFLRLKKKHPTSAFSQFLYLLKIIENSQWMRFSFKRKKRKTESRRG